MDVILQEEIKQCVTDEVAKVMEELNGQGANLDTVLAKIQEVLESIPNSMVKSVQKGTTNAKSVSIAEVNPDKCIVILNNGVLSSDTRYGGSSASWLGGTDGAILTSLTATELKLTTNDYIYEGSMSEKNGVGTVSWQIIEFY